MSGYSGSPYKGISMLLKGQKLKVCKDRKNTMPKWNTNMKAKVPTKDGAYGRVYEYITPFFRVMVPSILFLWGILIAPFIHVSNFESLIGADHSFVITRMVFTMVLIFISLKVADASELKRKEMGLIDKII